MPAGRLSKSNIINIFDIVEGKQMGRYKYLFKNVGLLTLSNFATKLLGFFLVPLYTNVLTTAEYGTYDLFNTTAGVMIPILTLNIQESVMRFSLDKQYDRKAVLSVGIRYLLFGTVIMTVGLLLNACFEFVDVFRDYSVLFLLMFVSQAFSGIVLNYIRGIEKITDLSISSVISSMVIIGSNLLFLVVFKWGLKGYFIANIIGPLIQCVFLWFRDKLCNCVDFRKHPVEKKDMLSYSKPLILNNIAWWINNSLDRYVVIYFCGLAANGVFSIASKIPSILNIFQSIFNQAWTLSAVKDFDSEDKDGFFANTYKAYNCIMTLVCSAIIVLDKLLAKFLYAKDFYSAWKYVPWLTIAIVFGALSGYLGGFFSAVKNSKIFARSTIIGSITNIILNIYLTKKIGMIGAAIATAICYMVVWAIRYWHSKRYINLKINIIRDIVSYILLAFQSCVLVAVKLNIAMYAIEIFLFLVVIVMYLKDIKTLFRKILKRNKA